MSSSMAASSASRRLVVAGAAVGAATVVVACWRYYRRSREIDDEPVPAKTINASTAAPGADSEEVAKRLEEALRCKERGNKRVAGQQFELAIKEYTQAIELAGADGKAKDLSIYYGNRAQCHFNLEAFDQALADCTTSIEHDPKYIKALVRRATTYEKLNRLEEARACGSGEHWG